MEKDKRNKPNVIGGQDIVAEQPLSKANDDSYILNLADLNYGQSEALFPKAEGDDGFYCTVKVIKGLIAPKDEAQELGADGQALDHPKVFYRCLHQSKSKGRVAFELVGDVQDFFADVEAPSTLLFVPNAAVEGNNTINLNNGVIIEKGNVEAARVEIKRTGKVPVIIYRISGKTEASRVKQSPSQLIEDFFGETSLASIYKGCSNNQLEYYPVEYEYVDPDLTPTLGVIDIPAPEDMCGNYNWVALEQWTWEKENWQGRDKIVPLNVKKGEYVHRVFVMPSEDCVDWHGAAAYGTLSGFNSYFPSQYASVPGTQAHEFGHNIALGHSGITRAYDDPTCNMGNKFVWSEDGSKICFNAAKMYTLRGWYPHHSKAFAVTQNQTYTLDFIGIDDLKRGLSQNGVLAENDVLTGLFLGDAENRVLMMFNRKEGVNSGVSDFEDQIVIVSAQASSRVLASLAPGQSWSYQANQYKTVTFKFNEIKVSKDGHNIERAEVEVTISGEDDPREGKIEVDDSLGNWKDAFDGNNATHWLPGTKDVKVWYKFPTGIRKKVVALEFTRPPTNAKGANFEMECNLKGYLNGDAEKNERSKYWHKFDLSQKAMYRIQIPKKKQGLYEKYKLWCKRSGQQTGKFKAAEIRFITEGGQ